MSNSAYEQALIMQKELSAKCLLVNNNQLKQKQMNKLRLDHEMPKCISEWGWKFHHIGIPTQEPIPGEEYLPHLKFYVAGFPESPFGIEWMRFDNDCPIPHITKTIPHIAFEVEDIDEEFAKHNFEIISEPGKPSEGVRAAMILYNGAPVELIEFKKDRSK